MNWGAFISPEHSLTSGNLTSTNLKTHLRLDSLSNLFNCMKCEEALFVSLCLSPPQLLCLGALQWGMLGQTPASVGLTFQVFYEGPINRWSSLCVAEGVAESCSFVSLPEMSIGGGGCLPCLSLPPNPKTYPV